MAESWERIYWLNMAAKAEKDMAMFRDLHDEYMARAREADLKFREEG